MFKRRLLPFALIVAASALSGCVFAPPYPAATGYSQPYVYTAAPAYPQAAPGSYAAPDGYAPQPGYGSPSPQQSGYAPSQPQPGAVQTAYGTTCYAGFYTCALPQTPIGSQCSCPGLGAPSFGTVE